MSRRGLVIACALTLAAAANAGVASTSGSILLLGAGARGLSMGGAYSTLATGSDALYWNPAGLASERTVEIGLNHQPLMKTLNYNAGSFAWPMGSAEAAVGYGQLKSDTVDSFDEAGASLGTFNASEQVASFGLGKAWSGWQGGAAGKWIRSSLANTSAGTWAADAGMLTPAYANGVLRHSLVVQNLGGKLRYDQTGEKLPLQLRIGTLVRALPSLRLAGDVIRDASGTNVGVGSRYDLPLASDRWSAFLSVGYSTVRKDLGAGLAFGGGVAMDGLHVDFAWIPENDFGSSQVFTLTYRFASPAAPPREAAAPAPKVIEQKQNAVPTPVVIPPPPASPNLHEHPTYEIKAAERRSRVYVVRPGDTLGKIAQEFYGSSRLWSVIYTANRHLLSSPSDVEVGQRLIIPVDR